ncbi:MAG: hypothetical protein ACREE9_02420 [Stellaceae bacterium]
MPAHIGRQQSEIQIVGKFASSLKILVEGHDCVPQPRAKMVDDARHPQRHPTDAEAREHMEQVPAPTARGGRRSGGYDRSRRSRGGQRHRQPRRADGRQIASPLDLGNLHIFSLCSDKFPERTSPSSLASPPPLCYYTLQCRWCWKSPNFVDQTNIGISPSPEATEPATADDAEGATG